MDNNNNNKPLGERVAILETKFEELQMDINEIKIKLDELLTLKHKGMGAIGLVSIIFGSGLIGLFSLIGIFFSSRPHG